MLDEELEGEGSEEREGRTDGGAGRREGLDQRSWREGSEEWGVEGAEGKGIV